MGIGERSHVQVVPCRIPAGDVQANARKRTSVEAGSRDRCFRGDFVPFEEEGPDYCRSDPRDGIYLVQRSALAVVRRIRDVQATAYLRDLQPRPQQLVDLRRLPNNLFLGAPPREVMEGATLPSSHTSRPFPIHKNRFKTRIQPGSIHGGHPNRFKSRPCLSTANAPGRDTVSPMA
jgi:hypothetical protein